MIKLSLIFQCLPGMSMRAWEMHDANSIIISFPNTKIFFYFQNDTKIFFYFQNDIQAPLNRQIIKSSETIMYFVDIMDGMLNSFMGPKEGNDVGTTDHRPRNMNLGSTLGTIVNFAQTLYNLTR